MRKDPDIIISLTTSNPPEVDVTDHNAKVSPGGQVTWTCANHPFAILFKNGAPFDKMAFAGDPGETVKAKVTTTKLGTYDYEVAVTCTQPPQPGLLDPKIIVE